jgi:hypothetical protein
MNKVTLFILLLSTSACAQVENQKGQKQENTTEKIPHKYGGWYCPDNLNGFPPVDITDWQNVPVINHRLPTKEETQKGASLMYIDVKEYPDAKPLEITLPKLATYYDEYNEKKEYIIIIQAVNIQNDSIVGFRYLNGGNGSALINKVKFLSDHEIEKITPSKFVYHNIKINATQEEIWEVIYKREYLRELQHVFSKNIPSKNNWRDKTNVNFYYTSTDFFTTAYAGKLYGSYYIQNDYLLKGDSYTEKFLLIENKNENYTELKIVCGPFQNDFLEQQTILQNWAEEVKTLVEK